MQDTPVPIATTRFQGVPNTLRILLSFAVVCLTVMLGPAKPASACSCVSFDAAIGMDDAALVFTGQVVDEQSAVGLFGEEQTALLFDVDQVFKGDVLPQVVVNAPTDVGAGCGIGVRGPMAVLAYSDGQSLSSSSCSSASLDATTLDLLVSQYGPGEAAPTLESPGLLDESGIPGLWVAGALAFVAALVAGIFVAVRGQTSEQ
ncbi:MAG: hypothetical protein HKN03_03620 [Acidimicrobiales bacterium]|nr:hypothetical protein [Acidimicrobiales bacterium]